MFISLGAFLLVRRNMRSCPVLLVHCAEFIVQDCLCGNHCAKSVGTLLIYVFGVQNERRKKKLTKRREEKKVEARNMGVDKVCGSMRTRTSVSSNYNSHKMHPETRRLSIGNCFGECGEGESYESQGSIS